MLARRELLKGGGAAVVGGLSVAAPAGTISTPWPWILAPATILSPLPMARVTRAASTSTLCPLGALDDPLTLPQGRLASDTARRKRCENMSTSPLTARIGGLPGGSGRPNGTTSQQLTLRNGPTYPPGAGGLLRVVGSGVLSGPSGLLTITGGCTWVGGVTL